MASHKISYEYDAVGNRTRMTDHLSGEETTYTYDVRNQLQTMDDSSGTTTFTYDMNGNRIRKETPADMIDYTWDGQQRLVKVETANDEVNLTYNPDGQRVKKESNAGIASYLYDFNHLLQEMDGDDQTEKLYTFTDDQWGDLISEYSEEDGSLCHQYDAQWSTQALLDEDESVTDRYKYRAFGLQDHAEGTSKAPHTFVGKQGYYRDTELDLYMLGMGNGDGLGGRFYDPELGRFISEDPRRHDAGDENLYRYVKNNPINSIDPTGQGFPVARPLGPSLEIGDGDETEDYRDVGPDDTLALEDLTIPALYVLATTGHGVTQLVARAAQLAGDALDTRLISAAHNRAPLTQHPVKARGWVALIEEIQKERNEEQKTIVRQLDEEWQATKDAANAYLKLYEGIDLGAVKLTEIKRLNNDPPGEALQGPECTWIVRVPLNLTDRQVSERTLESRYLGDPRVWVALESYPKTTTVRRYASTQGVKPQYGSGYSPTSYKEVTSREKRWRPLKLNKGKGTDPYRIWANVHDTKSDNYLRVYKQVEDFIESRSQAETWSRIAGTLEFALDMLPFGGAVRKIASGEKWTTEDTIFLIVDTASLLTGVGGVLKAAGKATAAAAKGAGATSRTLKWGARIQRTGAAMQLGAAGFSVSLAAGDLATADSDAERVQALSTMAFAMLMLADVPRSKARPKADEFVKAGKKNTTPGRLQEAAEKGVKANTVSPKQRKLKPSDISCLKKCFPAGTLVESESGLRPIEQISENDRVWGRSEVTGRWSLARVVECYERVYEGELVTLTLSSGEEIQATGSHPFWLAEGEDLEERPVLGELALPERSSLEGRWVECRDVRPGDQLASLHGEAVQVTCTASRLAEITVHNLQIAELATYTVGAAGVWVHNNSGRKKLCPKGTVKKILDDVPSVRGGEFQRWFKSLTPDELDQVWSNPALRRKIEARLRSPGGFHEWLPVSRAPKFKRWGITVEQIQELRTATSKVRFKPSGRHGGKLSTTAHNEILKIVDDASDYATFGKNLQAWAERRLVGGANALPPGLRP